VSIKAGNCVSAAENKTAQSWRRVGVLDALLPAWLASGGDSLGFFGG
jgi:hypothetical protein